MPRNIALPFRLGSKTEIPPLAGPYGTWLGAKYDPIFTDFTAIGTRPAPAIGSYVLNDPYLSIRPTDRLTLGAGADAGEEMDAARFDVRRSLLGQFDRSRAWLEAEERVEAFSQQQRQAFSLLSSGNVHRALDLAREPHVVREQYGMNLFGQSTLAARRLVEAGCKFVTVFFDAFGRNAGGWDTHDHHFPRLKDFLLPVFDQTYSTLILDLEARGLLDETLVLCLSEHGRTPRLDSRPTGAGRDHWSRAYCQVYAGGGMGKGNLVGRTDANRRRRDQHAVVPQGRAGDGLSLARHRPAHDCPRPHRSADANCGERERAARANGVAVGKPPHIGPFIVGEQQQT